MISIDFLSHLRDIALILQDLDDRRMALDIASDVELSHVLGYLTSTNYEHYLPQFIQDTSFERVEWVCYAMLCLRMK